MSTKSKSPKMQKAPFNTGIRYSDMPMKKLMEEELKKEKTQRDTSCKGCKCKFSFNNPHKHNGYCRACWD